MKHLSHSVINGLNSISPGQPLIAHLDRMRAEALTLNSSGLKCQQLFNKIKLCSLQVYYTLLKVELPGLSELHDHLGGRDSSFKGIKPFLYTSKTSLENPGVRFCN